MPLCEDLRAPKLDLQGICSRSCYTNTI